MDRTHALPALVGHNTPLRIAPRAGWRLVDLVDLWRYRELLWMLALRDLRVRYKQSVVGAAWAVLQPLTTMVVFTTLFRLLGQTPASSGPVPYAVTTFCALLPWQLFSQAVAQSGESLIANQQLITKVYFPRVAIPAASILPGLIDFAVAFAILLGMLCWFGLPISWHILAVIPLVGMASLAAFAAGLWLSALTALYRDFRFVIPFLIQVGFFVSPVVYESTAIIPENWQSFYWLNPMVGVIEGFRWAVLGVPLPRPELFATSLIPISLLLITGLVYFRRMERLFADRI